MQLAAELHAAPVSYMYVVCFPSIGIDKAVALFNGDSNIRALPTSASLSLHYFHPTISHVVSSIVSLRPTRLTRRNHALVSAYEL